MMNIELHKLQSYLPLHILTLYDDKTSWKLAVYTRGSRIPKGFICKISIRDNSKTTMDSDIGALPCVSKSKWL